MAIASDRFTAKPGGTMEGVFVAVRASIPIAVIPNTGKPCAAVPGSRGIGKRMGFEIGAGWTSLSQRSHKEKTSFKLGAPGSA
ncbi:hypothetical protein ATER59S_00519 [Aquamicrobium terrae]